MAISDDTKYSLTGAEIKTLASKVNEKAAASSVYTKTEIDSKLTSAMTYKGTVATVADLPSSGNKIGDVYNVTATGDNYAWDGSAWDKLSGVVDLSNYYTKTETDTELSGKVDKVSGKGLSEEDFTSTEKTKLDGIESGAEANVQSNWSESDTSSDAYIQNRPYLFDDANTELDPGDNQTPAIRIRTSHPTQGSSWTTYTRFNKNDFSLDTSTKTISSKDPIKSISVNGTGVTPDINGNVDVSDTTYSDFVGATSGDAGTHGLVPAPASGDTDKYLKSDGSWATVSQYSLPAATANTLGGVKIGSNLSMDANDVLSAVDTTYSAFTGATASTTGTTGLVPAPAAGDESKVLKADGTWAVPDTGIKTLTTDDYNWPETGTKLSIALWKLTPGYYQTNDDDVLYYTKSSTSGLNGMSHTSIIVGSKSGTTSSKRIIMIGKETAVFEYDSAGVLLEKPQTADANSILRGVHVIDDLTTSLSDNPLSAAQGKVLKDLIDSLTTKGAGAPTTSTIGTVGQLYQDTTNGKLYICTDATNPYVWTEVGSGATVYDSTISLTNNGSALDSFTVNASSNKTISLNYPTINMTATDPGEGAATTANTFTAVYSAS